MVATVGRWGRLAPSLLTMVNEADRLAPGRSTRSDGSVGDTSHRARASFHNPSGGYVDALDLTHDPAGGFDAHARARQLVARGDARLDHVISNREIWSANRPAWRPYTGANPHVQHAHFAVKRNALGRNGTGLWWPAQLTPPPMEDDDMTPEQEKKLDEIHKALVGEKSAMKQVLDFVRATGGKDGTLARIRNKLGV